MSDLTLFPVPSMIFPPITVVENGDVSTFNRVEEAESYMEPVDVEHGEYVVVDANGNKLRAEVSVVMRPIFFGLWMAKSKRVRIVEI